MTTIRRRPGSSPGNDSKIVDPLFRLPPGTLLRLRDEWLAALGLVHLAAAAGLGGLALDVPVVTRTGVAAFVIAFAVSLALDQPFGPVLLGGLPGIASVIVLLDYRR